MTDKEFVRVLSEENENLRREILTNQVTFGWAQEALAHQRRVNAKLANTIARQRAIIGKLKYTVNMAGLAPPKEDPRAKSKLVVEPRPDGRSLGAVSRGVLSTSRGSGADLSPTQTPDMRAAKGQGEGEV